MSAPTKVAAYRSGYRRALKDVRRDVDRLIHAVVLIERHAAPDATKAQTIRSILNSVHADVLWPLERENDNHE